MLFRIITWFIVIAVILRLINKYIRPVFQMTAMTTDRMRKMQEEINRMNEKMDTPVQKKRVKKEGDYIDYEEIK